MSDELAADSQKDSQPRNPADHLKEYRWKPGQSGNPNGGKRKWLTEVTEELLREKLEDPEAREVYKAQLWKKLLSERVVGSMTLDKVWERTEGKIKQEVEVSGDLNLTISERMRKAEERLKGE